MGISVSKALATAKDAAAAAGTEVEADLQDLAELLRIKEKHIYRQLEKMKVNDKEITVKHIVAEMKHSSVQVSSDLADGIPDAIEDLLGDIESASLQAAAIGAG